MRPTRRFALLYLHHLLNLLGHKRSFVSPLRLHSFCFKNSGVLLLQKVGCLWYDSLLSLGLSNKDGGWRETSWLGRNTMHCGVFNESI